MQSIGQTINVYVSSVKCRLTSIGVDVLAVRKLTVAARRRTPTDDAVQFAVCVPEPPRCCCCCWRITWPPWDKLPSDVKGCREEACLLGRVSTHRPWDETSICWLSSTCDDETRCTSNTICLSQSLHATNICCIQDFCYVNIKNARRSVKVSHQVSQLHENFSGRWVYITAWNQRQFSCITCIFRL